VEEHITGAHRLEREISHDGLDERRVRASGDTLNGPVIIEEYGATTVVYPAQRVEADRFGNLILTRSTT